MQRIVLTVFCFLFVSMNDLVAQCAMCRSTLENNLSNGSPGIAAGINTGILYLLVIPYLIAMVLGYVWYKSSKHNAGKNISGRIVTK